MTPRWPGTVETLARGGGLLRFDFVAHGGDGFGIGADKNDAGIGERAGERRALGQEAIARMHRLGAARLAGSNDVVDDQIALRRRRRPDRHRVVGHFDMERVVVGLGIDRDGSIPIRRAVLMIRQAISPRLAIRMRLNI